MTDAAIDAALDQIEDDALTAHCTRIPSDGNGTSGAPAILADVEPDDEADVDRLIEEIVAFVQTRMGQTAVPQ